ncbi:MAG: PAS domain S-box protein [Elusimicrobia bacterium]|nr:PAS domain S-box protein [Elusimicrobiota bacterium]
MPGLRSRSLSTRLLIWIVPISVAGSLAITIPNYFIARSVILQETQKGIAAVTDSAAAQAKSYFEQRQNDIVTISQSPLFKDHYMNAEYGLTQEAEVYRMDIERMLVDLECRAKAYTVLCYVDKEGREVVRVERGRAVTPRGAPRDISQTRSNKPSGIMHDGGGPPFVRSTVPLGDGGGKVRGALVFDASLGPVYDALGRVHLGVSGRSFLTTRPKDPLYGEYAAKGPVLTAVAPIAGTEWSVATAVERADFIERLGWVSTMTFVLLLSAGLTLILALTRKVRTLLAPLQALAAAAQAYARGDLGVRVPAEGSGEVAALSDSFNAMADALKARTEDLLRRVRELSSLQRMNDAVLRQLGKESIGAACLDAAVSGLGYQRGMLFWVDGLRKEVVGAAAKGFDGLGLTDDELRARRVPLGGGDIVAVAARGREAILVLDPAADPRCDPEFVRRTDARSFCIVPIVVRDKTIAVLGLSLPVSGTPIGLPELKGLALFAGAAGLALENAELLDAVTESEARYRTAVENSPYAVVGLDRNCRITLWNRRAESLFGYSALEAAGHTLEVVFGPAVYKGLLRRVETEGALHQEEAAGAARDGRPLMLSLSWTGQNAGPGGEREWFVVLEDLSEKKRLQAQLVRSEKLSAVGSVLSGVAHELNSPLGAVTGLAELLKDDPAGSGVKEELRHIYDAAMRCRDIVSGLLLFVRKRKPVRERVTLNFAIQSTLSMFEYRLIKSDGIVLEVDLDPSGPTVAGSFHKLQQLALNLLANARDAVRSGLGSRTIRVRTRRRPEGSTLEVEDNGPGVPPELRKTVFEPFFTTKPLGQGTGLGLSVCAKLVEDSDGRIRCEETPGGGARFVVDFPPCPDGLPEPAAELKLPPSMPGRRVLVADDEPELLQVMLRLLAEDGLIASAVAPAAALDKVRQGGFDLLITDIDLGPVKGTALLEAARALPGRPPVILVSGDILNEELDRELTALKAPVLAKPFLRSEFLRLVRRVLQDSYAPRFRGRA